MALELQTALPAANVPLFPIISMQTSVVDGRLVVSAYIEAAFGHVDNYGTDAETWQQLAPGKAVLVENLLALPDDLAALAPEVAAAWPVLVGLCQGINTIRKLV